MSQSERRRTLRMGLSLPVRVQGFNPDRTSWEEISTTDDVSQGGVSFPLKRPLQLGQVLLLTLPLPKRLRQFDLNDASYRIYALVRGMTHRPDHSRIGVMFFGKFPPRGFHENPAARYLLPTDSAAGGPPPPRVPNETPAPGPPPPPAPAPPPAVPDSGPDSGWSYAIPSAAKTTGAIPSAQSATKGGTPAEADRAAETGPKERRGHPRFELFVNFTLQQVDEFGAVLQQALALADNLSGGGAHLVTELDFEKGDVVLLQEAGGGFATRAEVRDRIRGKDGAWRLHLKFLDRQAPDRLLKS